MKHLKKLSKKGFSFLLSLLLLFNSVVPYQSVIAEESSEPTIKISSFDAYKGNYYTLYVDVENLSNLGGLEYSIHYDPNVFEITSANSGYMTLDTSDINTSVPGEIHHSLLSLDGLNGGGTLMVFGVYVKNDTEAKQSEFKITVGEAYDTSFNALSLNKESGKVNIKGSSDTVETAYFYSYLNQYEVKAGDTLRYTFQAGSLYEVAGGNFEFTYDSEVFQLEQVELSWVLDTDTAVYSINTEKAGTVKVSYIDLQPIENWQDLIYLDFTVIGKAASTTSIQSKHDSLTDVNLNPVNSYETNIQVTILETIEKKDYPDLYLTWDNQANNDGFNLQLWLEKDSKVAAGDFVIHYDYTKFTADSFTKSSQLNSSAYLIANSKMDEGKIKFSYVNTEYLEEDTLLAEIHFDFKYFNDNTSFFEITGSGVCDLQWNDIELDYPALDVVFEKHASSFEVTGIQSMLYTGNPIEFDLEVYHQGKLLSEEDYSIAYENNVDVGWGSVIITGKNDYYGKYAEQFEIFEIQSIQIDSMPYKTRYMQKFEEFNPEGGYFSVLRSGSSELIQHPFREAEITGFDNSTVGMQTLTLTYMGKSVEFEIEIEEVSINSMWIYNWPYKTSYLEGVEELDLTGGEIRFYTSNGVEVTIPMSEAEVTGFDNTKPGGQELTVSLYGHTTTFWVNIEPKSVESIEISKLPSKLQYIEYGEWLDIHDGEVTIHYNNNTSEVMPMMNVNVYGFDNSILGKQTITVEYWNCYDTFEVEIIEKSVQWIAITRNPDKTQYLQYQEELDLYGGELYVEYNNYTWGYIDMLNPEVEITGFDNTREGTIEVLVHYKGQTTTMYVDILALSLESVRIANLPDKQIYIQNYEDLDLTGGTLELQFGGGHTSYIEMNRAHVYGFNNSKLGRNTITVEYEGYRMTFQVTIVEKSLEAIYVNELPYQTSYVHNYSELDLEGGSLTLQYNDGSTDVLPMKKASVFGYDNTKLGECVLTVEYQGVKTYFSVEIKEKSLQFVELTRYPDKQIYIQNYEQLDLSGGELTLHYDDESKEVVPLSDATVKGFDNSKVGKIYLNFEYEGSIVVFPVEIVEKSAVSIEVIEPLDKQTYIQNYEELDCTGGLLQVYFNDESTEVISFADAEITGFNNQYLGENVLTITYGDASIEYSVEIIEKSLIHMDIYRLPEKTEFIQNYEELDVNGGLLALYYDDLSCHYLPMEEANMTGFSNETLGLKTITVEYQGFTADFTVEIVAKRVVAIEMGNLPDKIEYIQNYENLDLTGGELTLIYSDESRENIALSEVEVIGFNNAQLGTVVLKVIKGQFETEFEITIVEKSAIRVEIENYPNKTEYFKGYEKLDVTGGLIHVYYDDESEEVIDMKEAVFSGFDNQIEGAQLVTGNYENCEFSFMISVIYTELEIEEVTERIYPGDTLILNVNIDGGKNIQWKSSNTGVATVNPDGIVLFKKAGTVKITATIFGQTKTIEINCEPINLTIKGPSKMVVGNSEVLEITNSTDRDISWSISDETILSLNEETGTITALAPGQAVLEGKVGSVKQTLNITVYPIDPSYKISSVIEGYLSSGMEPSETMKIETKANGESINELMEYTSSNPNAVIVDEEGNITAIAKGSAKITASLKDDPAKRKVTLDVKVIDAQARAVEVFVESELIEREENELTMEYESMEKGTMIPIGHQAYDRLGNPMESKVNWTTSDTKVASIKSEKEGTYLVINGAGQITISVQVQDARKETEELTLRIKEYMPKLEDKAVKLNGYESTAKEVKLYPAYGTEITEISLHEYDAKAKGYLEETSENFNLELDGNKGILTLNNPQLQKGNYKVLLKAEVDGTRVYEYELTIALSYTLPSPTVTVTGYVDTFNAYNSTIGLSLDHKGNTLEDIELEGTEAFERNFEVDLDGNIVVNGLETESNGKLNTKGTLKLYYAQYNVPVEKSITLITKAVKPSYKVEPGTITFNPEKGNAITAIQLIDSKTKEVIDLDEGHTVVMVTEGLAEGMDIDAQNDVIVIEGMSKAGTLKFEVGHEEWSQRIAYSVKLATYTKTPEIQLSTKTITLNSKFNTQGTSALSVKPFNAITDIQDVTVEAASPNAETAKLDVYVGAYGIVADVIDGSIKNGSYKYNVKGTLSDGTELKAVALTIKVENTEPQYKISSTSLKLNAYTAQPEIIKLTETLSKNTYNVEVSGMEVRLQANTKAPEQQVTDIVFERSEEGIEAYATADAKVGTYTYYIRPEFDGILSDKEVKVSVQVYDKAPSAKVSLKGNLNPIDIQVKAEGTVKLSNLVDEVESAEIEHGSLETEVIDGKVYISLKEGEVLSDRTIKTKMILTMKNTQEEIETEISVKVARAVPTLKMEPSTLNIYDTTGLNELVGSIKLNMSKVEAEVESIESLNTAVLDKAYRVELRKEAEEVYLDVYLLDGAKIKAGSTTSLKYKIIYVGESDLKKAPSITIKIADKSAAIKGKMVPFQLISVSSNLIDFLEVPGDYEATEKNVLSTFTNMGFNKVKIIKLTGVNNPDGYVGVIKGYELNQNPIHNIQEITIEIYG